MKAAGFEEREYESPLYSELDAGTTRLWSPGQVLEHALGFDRATFSIHPEFWALHGMRTPLPGIAPRYYDWPILPGRSYSPDRLPRFRLNCFLQAKRPDVGRRIPRALRQLGLKSPVFRINLDTDQQLVLERAANEFDGRALFVYAAPAFGTPGDLFRNTSRQTIVANSQFPDVRELKGHGAWYYDSPGVVGVANPDYERMESTTLEARIDQLVARSFDLSETEGFFLSDLQYIRETLQQIFRESDTIAESPRVATLVQEWNRIDSSSRLNLNPAVAAFEAVRAFAYYFKLIWLTIA